MFSDAKPSHFQLSRALFVTMAFSTGPESIDFIANDCNRKLDQSVSGGLPRVEESENIHVPNVGCFFRSVEAPAFIRGLTPEERKRREKTLLRKIDLRLLPTIVLMYILNYLDRNNIAVARLAGLERDLRLTSVQYNVSRDNDPIQPVQY